MLHSLPRVSVRSAKRRGRGVGSGKGFHTTGRGQKGQGARRHVGILFEGLKTKKSLLHRLPMLRGKEKFKRLTKPFTLSIEKLDLHKEGPVTLQTIIEQKLVRKVDAKDGVKIVGNAKLTKKFEVSLPASLGAQKAITEAGGKMI